MDEIHNAAEGLDLGVLPQTMVLACDATFGRNAVASIVKKPGPLCEMEPMARVQVTLHPHAILTAPTYFNSISRFESSNTVLLEKFLRYSSITLRIGGQSCKNILVRRGVGTIGEGRFSRDRLVMLITHWWNL
ncbi:uncharacterized protein LDX57_011965 [Aspergillus melleus]|uniref:uncharacterized protein n=1 Tax=Aspergillus melleus TaxID=138277 RepID=UPI001E8D7AE8|nr:uncharacterized protein LDX57_011965 [Aspergillus melleus]KAH8434318.1 hypothetical protein LDX57_011965 [Aspergillus melleus]